ncbi:hypothetical protein PENSUB_7714 [Penicillium subrubescens]|uniref:Uncharacterized protein n=1 Tax=Penicillium subrubescens TaxID=1316194 RepID=A0A1Q5TKN2_9EURO|nr:hypothetical protein PENSUB_7714 [Penicillium subrubescens]
MGYSWGEVVFFESSSSGIKSSGKCSQRVVSKGSSPGQQVAINRGGVQGLWYLVVGEFHTVPNKIEKVQGHSQGEIHSRE